MRRFLPSDGAVRLFSIGGVDVCAVPSWLIQVIALTAVARVTIAELVVADVAGVIAWLLSFGLALAIIGSIVVHEFAHTVVALTYGLPVRRILLFVYGGVSQIDREAPSPRAEYHIAIAGPMASVVLATVLAGVGRLFNPSLADVPGAWGWFARINIALAIFNLLPAFPMDGGRLVRSALWAGIKDRVRATRLAAWAGQGFGALLVGAGAFVTLVPQGPSGRRQAFQGIWLFFLGSFLFNAAGAAGRAEGGAEPDGDGGSGG